jgi:hypothetical protein
MRKTKIMKRDVALRIDSLLIGIRESLGYVATYMEANVSAEEYKKYVPFIGESMGGTVKCRDVCTTSSPTLFQMN